MRPHAIGLAIALGVTGVSLSVSACAKNTDMRAERMGLVEKGPGSLAATRKALEGAWTLASLELVDAQGARRNVKASGQLSYDAYSNMTIRAVIEDTGEPAPLVIDYQGRIFIDPAKAEFYPADLVSLRPVEPGQGAAVSPDKIRKYELSPDSFVVTYLDGSAKPTAIARWRR